MYLILFDPRLPNSLCHVQIYRISSFFLWALTINTHFCSLQFYKRTVLFHEDVFQGINLLADQLFEVSSDRSHRVVSQSFGSSSGCLRPWNRSLCREIQSLACCVCVACARSSGSGKRCSGVHLIQTTAVLLPCPPTALSPLVLE